MKRSILTIAFLVITLSSFSQIPKLKDIENLRNSEVIIGLTGDGSLDYELKRIMSQFWDICPIVDELPLKEAREKAKENDNLYVLYVDSYSSSSFPRKMYTIGDTEYRFKNISVGYYVGISNGKKKPLMYSGIPVFDGEITDEAIAHGTNYINQIFTMMLDNEVNAMKTLAMIKKDAKALKQKTLFIPEWWVDGKLTKENISESYGGEYQIVSHYEWSQAILNKTSGIAYAMIIPAAVGGKYVYQHHLCDAETGKIYGITQPKVGAVEMMGINLSSANKGYIAKKNLKQYNGVLKGK